MHLANADLEQNDAKADAATLLFAAKDECCSAVDRRAIGNLRDISRLN